MNIFKVLASAPRDRFTENQVSAFLGWILNPYMDHGLGFEFLIKFLERIKADDKIIERLKMRITDKNENAEVKVFLEHELGEAIIDIVLVIDENYCVSIENKIYSSAASNEEQLKTQYRCLRNNDRHKSQEKTMVFLVPKEEGTQVEKEYNNLAVESPDTKIKITWADIASDIQSVLNKEQNCEISPLGDYLRHTLKAFTVFIKGNFRGYVEDKQRNGTSSPNPKADKGYLTFEQINADKGITFVGIAKGITGLYQMDAATLKVKSFQCTTGSQPNRFWIERDGFIETVKSRTNGGEI
jgi:hypothetical protein